LPYTYNLDFQEVTRALWSAFEDTISSVNMLARMLGSIRFKSEVIGRAVEDEYFGATALAHRLTEEGVASFREAHLIVGGLVRLASEQGLTLSESVRVNFERVAEETLGRKVEVDVDGLASSVHPSRLLEMIVTDGGSNPEKVKYEVDKRGVFLNGLENWVSESSASLAGAEARLMEEVRSVLVGLDRR